MCEDDELTCVNEELSPDDVMSRLRWIREAYLHTMAQWSHEEAEGMQSSHIKCAVLNPDAVGPKATNERRLWT